MILISCDATTPVKGRPLLQAIVFLTPTRLHLSSFPAAVDAQKPRRQASGYVVRPSCSSVTSLITGRRAQRVLPSVPRFVRHHAGNTYTVSLFVLALQQRWNRISLIFLSLGCQSWPSSLLTFRSIFLQPRSSA